MNIQEYFTLPGLASYTGAFFFSLLIPNVIMSLVGDSFRPWARLTALIIAVSLALLGAAISEGDWLKYLVAVFNGILVYGAAYGINAQIVERQDAKIPTNVRSAALMSKPKRFFQKW